MLFVNPIIMVFIKIMAAVTLLKRTDLLPFNAIKFIGRVKIEQTDIRFDPKHPCMGIMNVLNCARHNIDNIMTS